MKVDAPVDVNARFRAQGYVKVPAFFTTAEMSKLREVIFASREAGDDASHLDRAGLTFYENVFLGSAYVRNFVTQEKVVQLLSGIIGTDFWLRWDQCVRKLPGGAAFAWHQDNAYTHIREEYFQLWVAITEGTQDNGGLWLAPSAVRRRLPHKRADGHLVCAAAVGTEVFVSAEPGDVVIFSSLVPHRTGPNRTRTERWAYVAELMSVNQYDPLLPSPYFVVSKGGRTFGEFVKAPPAGRSLRDRMRYFPLQARVAVGGALGRWSQP